MLCKETLKRVSSIAEQSKILALGESKHTSDGLYRAKFEVIRYLVEKGEVKCVLFENSWSRTEKVNAFLNSEASLEEAMAGFYGVWRSHSMAAFLNWLKSKRAAGYDIMVAGFDNQPPEEDLLILEEAGMNWIRNEIISLLGESEDNFEAFHDSLIKRFREHENRDQLLREFHRLADRISSLDVENAAKANLARESISSHLRDRATYAFGVAEERDDMCRRAYEIRDEAMASIAKQFIKGEKAVLWAHNLHIMKNGKTKLAWPMKTMGDCICADYGSTYKALALTAYHLDVNWPGNPNEKGAPIPHPDDSIEEKLRESGAAERVVDFSRKEDKLEFGGCRKMFEAVDVEGLENHFDAILYLEKSPAMEAFDS